MNHDFEECSAETETKRAIHNVCTNINRMYNCTCILQRRVSKIIADNLYAILSEVTKRFFQSFG